MERGYKEPIYRVCFFSFKLNGLLLRVASPPARQTRKLVGKLVSRGWVVRMLELFKVALQPLRCGTEAPGGCEGSPALARGKPQMAACQPVGSVQERPVRWLGLALSYATGKFQRPGPLPWGALDPFATT